MKVIFLDVDGVLNSDKFFDSIKDKNPLLIENQIEPRTLILLRKLINQTGAKVVLSSSIRNSKQGKKLIELLAKNQIRVYSSTPYKNHERGVEIKEWLSENEDIENFVILDDEVFESYDEYLISKLIKISNGNGMSCGEGLQEKDIEMAIEILGKIKDNENER